MALAGVPKKEAGLEATARKLAFLNRLRKIEGEKDPFGLKEKYPELYKEGRRWRIVQAFKEATEVGKGVEQVAKMQTSPEVLAMFAMDPITLPMMDISRIQAFKKMTRVPEEYPHPSSGTTFTHTMRPGLGSVIRGGKKFYQVPREQRKIIWDMLQRYPKEVLDFVKDINWEAGAFSGEWRPATKDIALNPSNLNFEPGTTLYRTGNIPRTGSHEIAHAFEDYVEALSEAEWVRHEHKIPERYVKALRRGQEQGIHGYEHTQPWEHRPGEQFAQSFEKMMVGPHVKGEPWEWRFYEPPGEIQHTAMELLDYLQRRSSEVPGITRFHGWLKKNYPGVHKGYFKARMGYKAGEVSPARYLKWTSAYDIAMNEWMATLPSKLTPSQRGPLIGPRIPPSARPKVPEPNILKGTELHHQIPVSSMKPEERMRVLDWHLKNLWEGGWQSTVELPKEEHKLLHKYYKGEK